METLFSFKYMRVLVAALLIVIILAVGSAAAQNLNWLSPERYDPTINVEGVAEVTAVPDVGHFSFTVEAEAPDVATAQKDSGEKINAIMEFLKNEGGVDEKDIKTSGYNTYPRYEWERKVCITGDCDRERVLKGYVVTQSVSVTVRDIEKAGYLLAGVGERGATNISGLNFEVDDIEGKKEEARLAAIADAKEKAKRLAKELGVRLGDIVSFNDGSGYYPMPMMEREALSSDMAIGGEFEEKTLAPEISVGEDTITARVTITYKIK